MLRIWEVDYDRKILLARILLAIALILAVISTFQNWELVENDLVSGEPFTRNFRQTGIIAAFGLLTECNAWFHPATIPIEPKTCFVARYAINLSLLLALLLPIALTRTLSYSRMIIGLWIFILASYLVALIYLHQKNSPTVFILALGSNRLGYQPHLAWLSGFYFACAAVVMHLLGIIVAYFSFDRKKLWEHHL